MSYDLLFNMDSDGVHYEALATGSHVSMRYTNPFFRYTNSIAEQTKNKHVEKGNEQLHFLT
jgi:hypothetical protein